MASEEPVLIIPKNSFVQAIDAMVHDNCAEQVSLCLPVYDKDDVAFQFLTSKYDSYQYMIQDGAFPQGPYTNLKVVSYTSTVDLVMFIGFYEMDKIKCGECFSIKMYGKMRTGDPVLLFQSNCFEKICDKCYTSKITYRCEEDSFDFIYSKDYIDSGWQHFYNTIRLPFYLSEPQYPVKRNVFVKSDGTRKKLSARIENSYELIVGWMPKDWHEKLIVALEHDTVMIDNINSGLPQYSKFTQEKEYKIDWLRFLNYPTAPASGQLMLTPYLNVNSNCK